MPPLIPDDRATIRTFLTERFQIEELEVSIDPSRSKLALQL